VIARDSQTAQQAIQASLCGYTVFTTIHGKSKYSVIQRMKQLGVSSFEIDNAVNLISYPRLIPSTNKLELFADFLDQNQIAKYQRDVQEDTNWRNLLNNAKANGIITSEIHAQFING